MTVKIKASNNRLILMDTIMYERYKYLGFSITGRGYVMTNKPHNGKRRKLHRLILNVDSSNIQVDHLNGNRLDNRVVNLRLATNKENSRNRNIKSKGTTSRFFGVTLDSREALSKRWIAQIKVDGKHIFLGRYLTEVDAAIAYNKSAKEYGFLTRNKIGEIYGNNN